MDDADLDYYWVIPHKLAGSSYPFAHLKAYHNVGFRAIVSLTPFPPLVESLVEEMQIHHHVSFVELFGWPNKEKSLEIMQFIDAEIANQNPVLVHCIQGNGRTGVVLAQYLIWKGVPVQKAIERIFEVRRTAFDSPEQIKFLSMYEETLQKSGHCPKS